MGQLSEVVSGLYARAVTGRWVFGVVGLLVVVLALVSAYFYGKNASCPPPDWWFDLFRQSGTYRCEG